MIEAKALELIFNAVKQANAAELLNKMPSYGTATFQLT